MRSKFGDVGSVRSGFNTEPVRGESHSKRRTRRVPFPVVTKLIPGEMCTRRRIPFGPSLPSAFLSVPPTTATATTAAAAASPRLLV